MSKYKLNRNKHCVNKQRSISGSRKAVFLRLELKVFSHKVSSLINTELMTDIEMDRYSKLKI